MLFPIKGRVPRFAPYYNLLSHKACLERCIFASVARGPQRASQSGLLAGIDRLHTAQNRAPVKWAGFNKRPLEQVHRTAQQVFQLEFQPYKIKSEPAEPGLNDGLAPVAGDASGPLLRPLPPVISKMSMSG
jgi:hypothetical protein